MHGLSACACKDPRARSISSAEARVQSKGCSVLRCALERVGRNPTKIALRVISAKVALPAHRVGNPRLCLDLTDTYRLSAVVLLPSLPLHLAQWLQVRIPSVARRRQPLAPATARARGQRTTERLRRRCRRSPRRGPKPWHQMLLVQSAVVQQEAAPQAQAVVQQGAVPQAQHIQQCLLPQRRW